MGYVDRATLIVLAETAEIGLPEATNVPAQAFDPLLRGRIRARAAEAVAKAEARTRVREGEHVLRVAFLLTHPSGLEGIDADDVGAVTASFDARVVAIAPYLEKSRARRVTAYREAAHDRIPEAPLAAPPPRPRRGWPVTTALGVGLTTFALGAAAVLVGPSLFPGKVERFRRTAFGAALRDPLTEVVAANGAKSPSREKLTAPKVERQIGPAAHARLEDLLSSLGPASRSTDPVDVAMAAVFANVNAVDAALVSAKVPAHLHAYARGPVGERSVWLTAYYAERRSTVTIDGEATPTVWGRRLDTLNLADVGVTKANAEDATLVSLDVLEATFVDAWLPSLMQEFSEPEADPSPRMPLRAHAERQAARELRDTTHVTVADARALSEAIARRNAALERAGRKPERRIHLGPEQRAALEALGGSRASEALSQDAHIDGVREKVDPAIFELVTLVEEGFLVRIRDEKRFATSSFPKLGVADGAPWTRARVASDLGLVARARCPHVALYLLADKVLSPTSGADRIAAEVALGLVVRELGGALPEGKFQENQLFSALDGVLAQSGDRLRSAARHVYETVLVAPVPSVVRTPR